jgi:hypothetical protein
MSKSSTRTAPPSQSKFSFFNSNINKWQTKLYELLQEYKSYIPECDNFDRCEYIITTKYDAIRGWKKRDRADILLSFNDKETTIYKKSLEDFEEKLLKLKNTKIEEYRNKYSREEKEEEITELTKNKLKKILNEYKLYNPEEYSNCKTFERCKFLLDSRYEALTGFKIKDLKIDKINLDIFKNEMEIIKNAKIEEYKNKYSREEEKDSIIKINRWKDKIIELIYNFTISTIKCDTIEECNEIIDVINDILYSFIIRPNTMTEIISEKTSSSKDIYNYRRYRIFIKYLNDYKTKLDDNDLLNPEYIKSSEELKQILEKTKLFKNDFCINKFLSS